MSRTRTVLAAALLTTAVGLPLAVSASAAPQCTKPGAAELHELHEELEVVPVAGPTASEAVHDVEGAYCSV